MNKKEYMKEMQDTKIAIWTKFQKSLIEACDFIDEVGLKYEMKYEEVDGRVESGGCYRIRVWDTRHIDFDKAINHLPDYSEVVKNEVTNEK
jgi:hypothetical protein